MKISNLLKGGIYEVNFGYHSKLGGYMTLMSDINELYAIDFGTPYEKEKAYLFG